MSPGTETAGAVVSRTVTWNEPVPTPLTGLVAVQFTVVVPNGKRDPVL
jgi:hypothetical protein